MATWADVALALAGAPVGALITVIGVKMTNDANADAVQRQLVEQGIQQQRTLEFEVRRDHLRHVLDNRRDLYAALLEKCDDARRLAEWSVDPEAGTRYPEIDADDFAAFLRDLKQLRYRVEVVCPAQVRAQAVELAESVENLRDAHEYRFATRGVDSAAEDLEEAIVVAAIEDRVSGVTPEGLGGM